MLQLRGKLLQEEAEGGICVSGPGLYLRKRHSVVLLRLHTYTSYA